MEQDQKEKAPEQAGEWGVGKAAAEGGVVTVQVQVWEVSAFARIAEQPSRIRLALPARRLAVRSAASR